MPITPHLSRQLRQALGEKAAEELVKWIHEQDAEHTASRDTVRADIAEVRQELHAGVSGLRQELHAEVSGLRQELRAQVSGLRQELRAQVSGLRQETQAGFGAIREEMAHLETRIERRLGDLLKWSFVFWVGAVSAIAMLAGVLP